MPMTPLDLQNRRFRHAFRGYQEEEVDAFLDRLAKDYEQIYKENSELKAQSTKQEEALRHYQVLEGTLKETLVVAQQTAEEVRGNAGREAEIIQREARLKAEDELARAEAMVREAQQRCEELHRSALLFRGRMRSLLLAQLEMLKTGEKEEVAEGGESIG